MRFGFGLAMAMGCVLASPAAIAQDQNAEPVAAETSSPDAEMGEAAPANDVATETPPAEPATATETPPADAAATEQPAPATPEVTAQDIATIPVGVPEVRAPEAASLEAPGEKPVALDEVIVTATKREQSIRDIPASITGLYGDDLEKRGAQGVEDMARLVPGVTFSNDPFNASKVTIRGISTTTLGNPTTGVLFNDVSFTDSYLPRVTLDPNPFDMQTVEVLKGPQGTLFGSSALNGAVRYVPQPPKFGETELRWFAQYSMIDQGDSAPMYGAAVNLPWGEDLAFRGMVFKREAPGWIDNTRTGESDINSLDQLGARGVLGWMPGESWDVRLTYAWQETNVHDAGYSDKRDGQLVRNSSTQPSVSDSQYQFADLVVRYSFDGVDLVSDTAWVDKQAHKLSDVSTDLTGTPFPLVYLEDISDSKNYSQEFRLVSTDGGAWRWVTGVVGSHQELFFVPEYSTALTPGVNVEALLSALGLPTDGILARGDSLNILRVLTRTKIDEIALFGDFTRSIGESLELSLGGRLYRSKSGGYVLQDGALVLLQGQPQVLNEGDIKSSGFNPKASALWHFSEDMTLYAAISKGFRSGGLQPGFTTVLSAKQAPEQFVSDTLWNHELGLRTQWLDNTLRADATAFYIDWKDPQILLGDSVVHMPYLANVGRVKSIGVEAALQWLLPWVPGLSLNTSAAYISTKTAEAFVGQQGDNLPAGTPWPYAARWQAATTLAYEHEFGDWRTGAGVTHSLLSKSYADLEQTLPQFDYQQWDAQLSLSSLAIAWLPQFSVAVNNLTDERGISHASSGGIAIRTEKVTYIQPRAVLLRLSGSFN